MSRYISYKELNGMCRRRFLGGLIYRRLFNRHSYELHMHFKPPRQHLPINENAGIIIADKQVNFTSILAKLPLEHVKKLQFATKEEANRTYDNFAIEYLCSACWASGRCQNEK